MKNNIPQILISDAEPLQDYYDDGKGNQYSVARLIDEAKGLDPFDCPLASLYVGNEIWQGSNMKTLALHCKKVMDANLKYPIILDWNGEVADGRHRIIKALIEGKKTIKAVRLTWEMTPCRVIE